MTWKGPRLSAEGITILLNYTGDRVAQDHWIKLLYALQGNLH